MKATNTEIQRARVNDLVQFRLEGARYWDVRQYVTEKEKEPGSIWYRGENAKPHSEANLWRYIRRADKLISEDTRSSRKKRLRLHVAKRQNLYAKAISQGDVRTALAAADSEAKLLGLFPAKGIEVGNVNVVQVDGRGNKRRLRRRPTQGNLGHAVNGTRSGADGDTRAREASGVRGASTGTE